MAAPGTAEPLADALARLYDVDLVEDPGDLDLYLALAARVEGPVLELAAGTGRLAVPLAAAGHDVTAVDLDPAMLARLRRHAAAAGVASGRRSRARRGGPARSRPPGGRHVRPRVHRPELAVPARDPRRPAAGVPDDRVAPRAGRARRRRRLAARRRRPRPLRRPDDPRVRPGRSRDGPPGHEGRGRPARRRRPGSSTSPRSSRRAGPGEATARWIRRDALRLVSADELTDFATSAGLEVETVAGDYDLEPLGLGQRPGDPRRPQALTLRGPSTTDRTSRRAAAVPPGEPGR